MMSESRQGRVVPSDICITLATASDDRWLSADEVAGRLNRLGFEGLNAQRVSPMLRRLSRMEAPPVECQSDATFGYLEFRVTGWGKTWLSNLIPWTRVWR